VRRIFTTALLLALVSCRGGNQNKDQFKTQKVDRGDITMTVTATGTLSAVTTVQVGSQVSGVISRLYADFNSQVKKGQLLAELDPTPFQAQVEQRQADVTKARVDASNAKITYDRQARLAKAGLAAQQDLDNARAQYQGSNAGVQQATAALSQAQTNLRYTKIVSPIDGIVVDRQYDVGQTVAASFQAPTLFSIAQDLTKMQVQADVDQSDIGRIQVGQPASFTVDAFPDETFHGRISQIRLNATVTQNVVTYPVIIEVSNPDQRLRPKMTANVTIAVATVQGVLRVPNAALRFKPEGVTDTGARGGSGSSGARGSYTATAGGGGAPSAASPEGAATAPTGGRRNRGFGGAAGAFPGGASSSSGGQKRNGQNIYILDPATQKPKAVWIRTGITDGRFTQVVSGDLKEGDLVIVGTATTKVDATTPSGSTNPLAPQRGGPGGGGGGRGR